MKKAIAVILLFCTVTVLCTACDEAEFSSQLDKSLFEYILRDTEKGDVVIDALDAYSREGYCYYHIRYSYPEDGELKQMDVVYRGNFGRVTFYYNLNWENDSIILPMKDDFYDAVEYGTHKQYGAEEIERCVTRYFENN